MMLDFSPLMHAAVAVALQAVIGLSFGQWGVGGTIGCMWFIAREHAQAEYRWIAQFGAGKRANMPWWGGFDRRAWNIPSFLDWMAPVISCAMVWVIAHYLL